MTYNERAITAVVHPPTNGNIYIEQYLYRLEKALVFLRTIFPTIFTPTTNHQEISRYGEYLVEKWRRWDLKEKTTIPYMGILNPFLSFPGNTIPTFSLLPRLAHDCLQLLLGRPIGLVYVLDIYSRKCYYIAIG